MTQSLKEKAFLTTLGVVPEIPLIDVPEFHGVLIQEGLAQIGSSGTFAPYNQIEYIVTDPHSNPLLVKVSPSGKRTSTPFWSHNLETPNDYFTEF